MKKQVLEVPTIAMRQREFSAWWWRETSRKLVQRPSGQRIQTGFLIEISGKISAGKESERIQCICRYHKEILILRLYLSWISLSTKQDDQMIKQGIGKKTLRRKWKVIMAVAWHSCEQHMCTPIYTDIIYIFVYIHCYYYINQYSNK